jgi:hypothetical protein
MSIVASGGEQPRESEYFAGNPKSREAVSGALSRIRKYRESLRVSGRAEKMRRNWICWQGYGPRGDSDASRIGASGEQGELLNITVNHFASLANQACVLITGTKPAIKAVPTSSDFDSLAQAQFADALNDACERDLRTPELEAQAALTMILMSEVCLLQDWDARVGADEMVDEAGRAIKQGDVRVYVLTPFDFVVDPDVQDVGSHRWMCWRRRVSKWELAADYPEHADRLKSASVHRDVAADANGASDVFELRRRNQARVDSTSDEVYVWELRHLPTSACPAGRLIRFVDAETILFDSGAVRSPAADGEQPVTGNAGYPYQDSKGEASLMAAFASPEYIPGLIDGHTAFFDLLSLQEGVDLSATIMASAINSGGLQNLYVPRGANITATKLTGALNVVEFDGTVPPQAKENVAISPAIVEWAQMCVTWMRQRVSMNDVVVGETSKGMPAQAMALLRAQAVEFHSRMQASYERMVETDRTNILKMYQLFARSERVAVITGKGSAWAARSFSQASIGKVARYAVEAVNPVTKTLAGRVAFAQPLLDTGRITLEQYLRICQTGRDEPIYDFVRNNQARIQRVKEQLMKGTGLPPMMMGPQGPVLDPSGLPQFQNDGAEHIRPLITDTHWLDIPEWLSVLATPETRQNPAVVKGVSELVHYQLALWRAMDPAVIMLLGGTPAPPPMAPMGVMPGIGGGAPALGNGQGPAPQPGSGQPPGPRPERQPGLPQPPKNPLTGQQDQQTSVSPSLPQAA